MSSSSTVSNLVTGLVSATALWSCRPVDSAMSSATIRDSLGVTIIESSAPRWSDGAAWSLVEPPGLIIGSLDGDSDNQLSQVQGALLLDSQRLVLANQGSHELRFYDSRNGRLLHAVGREGEGPGEFAWMSWMSRFGEDSLFVWDARLRRGSVFDRDGTYGRSVALELQTEWAVLVLADRSIIATPFHGMQFRRFAQDGIEGSRRLRLPYTRFSPTGALVDTIGVFLGDEYWIEIVEHLHDWQRVFGLTTVVASGRSLLWVGTGESFQLEAFAPSGLLAKRIVYRTYAPVQVGTDDVDRWIEKTNAALPESSAEHLADYFAGMVPPENFPPYDRVTVDAEGNLWVESYRKPDEERHTWTVFATDGVMLGSLTVPAGFDITDVSPDRVIGTWRDSLDVEYVHLYSLLKPTSRRGAQ